MLTRAAVEEMIVPSLLPILIPVIVGFGMNLLFGPGAGRRPLPPPEPESGVPVTRLPAHRVRPRPARTQ